MVFLFPGNHIPKCRWSKKIGRKEVILRFFFFPRDLGWKKKPWQKKVIIEPQKVCIFSNFGLDTKFGWRFFFSPLQIPKEKKNRKIGHQGGREEIVCDYREKIKPYPHVRKNRLNEITKTKTGHLPMRWILKSVYEKDRPHQRDYKPQRNKQKNDILPNE